MFFYFHQDNAENSTGGGGDVEGYVAKYRPKDNSISISRVNSNLSKETIVQSTLTADQQEAVRDGWTRWRIETESTSDRHRFSILNENGIEIAAIEGNDETYDSGGIGFETNDRGDGDVDSDDVSVLFENLESDAVQSNPEDFDFNDDGDVDAIDIAELYDEITDDS